MRAVVALTLVLGLATITMMAGPAAQSERVPDSAVVSGVPQGIFVGRSLLTGRAVCLLFLSGGRITRAIPDGGLDRFDWARHQAAHAGDSGTWQMRGGQLVVAWGDGGVHQGPITVHPDGLEFYGKRYAKPLSVGIAAIAGRWESARGTAIVGGTGVNRVSELVIQADGRYQWGSTTGGVVSGRAVASDQSMSGRVTVTGLTITFTSDAGRATSHTFLPAAGTPVSAFAVDADMFTRVGPAPASAPVPAGRAAQPASPSAGASSATSRQSLSFALPAGWTSGMQQGHPFLRPANAAADSLVVVVLSDVEPLNGRSLDEWLREKMAADLGGGAKMLQSAPPTRGRSGPLDTLSAGRTVQEPSGPVLLQIYYAITDGRQAGLGLAATASEAAMQRHLASVQALFQSLRFGAAPAAAPGQPASGTGTAPGSKTTITTADVAGDWGHSAASYTDYVNSSGNRTGSSTISWGDGYSLAPNGTYAYLFTGMIDGRYIKEQDTGTWAFERGNLVIRSKTGRKPKEYAILDYQVAPDGVVFMTVLDVYYPRTQGNIEMYAEKWVKRPAK